MKLPASYFAGGGSLRQQVAICVVGQELLIDGGVFAWRCALDEIRVAACLDGRVVTLWLKDRSACEVAASYALEAMLARAGRTAATSPGLALRHKWLGALVLLLALLAMALAV